MDWLAMYLQVAIYIVLPAAAYALVFQKAGYSPWLGLLMLLPLVNLILLVWFATTTWPLERGHSRSSARDSSSSDADTTWEQKMAIRRGLSFEEQGLAREAIAQFESAAATAKGEPLGDIALGHIARIRAAQGENG
jgi:hypothetical protein